MHKASWRVKVAKVQDRAPCLVHVFGDTSLNLRSLLSGFAVFFLGLAFANVVTAQNLGTPPTKPSVLEIAYISEDDRISIHANQVPLNKVLQELSTRTNTTIVWWKEEFVAGEVSVNISPRSFEEALKKLLEGFNVVFFYALAADSRDGTTVPRLAKVLVVSRKANASWTGLAVSRTSSGVSPDNPADLTAVILDLQQRGDNTKLTNLLLTRVNHSDPEIQRIAVSFLIRSPDQRASEALADLVYSGSDLQIRQLAAYGLAQRGEVEGAEVLSQALKDPDPRARYMFLVALGNMGEKALPAVAQAVYDPDPTVAEAAKSILSSITPRR